MLGGLYAVAGDDFLAKIAVAQKTMSRVLARGDGWTVSDVVCRSGPDDRPYEERHSNFSIAIVAAGTFEYRSAAGRELMTPGSLMLGTAGQSFECGHEHGVGDRCVAFWYAPAYFERLAADAGARAPRFGALRVPPLRALAPLVARACAGLGGTASVSWEEMGVRVAAHALQLSEGRAPGGRGAPAGAVARVTQAVRRIERDPDDELSLGRLAESARLSPYQFLRTFERLTGVTPHQFVLRARLRRAATRLATSPEKILDLALESGFGDLSNFNRAFRAEFGVSPRAYRRQAG
jgi:AraC family transcriptional regulator